MSDQQPPVTEPGYGAQQTPSPTPPPAPPPTDTTSFGAPRPTEPYDPGPGFQQLQTLPPEPRRSWLIPFVAGLLVAVLAVLAFVLLTGGGPGPRPTPSPRTSPRPAAVGQLTPAPSPSGRSTPAPTATSGSGSPSASGSPAAPSSSGLPSDIAAQIDLVVSQVAPIRELQPKAEVPYEFITREQFQVDVKELLAEETSPEQLAAEERLLKRLRLLPADLDLAASLEELYGSQVAAFYRPDTGRFYVIERAEPFGAVDRVTVAHEYTHALQYQNFDLEGTQIKDPAEGDAALAQLAVIEGDATTVMIKWATEHLSMDELFELFTQSLSPTDQQILDEMPPILRRQLMFPYSDGYLFVSQLETAGGWDAVNRALTDPPESTEQIMHPEKYASDEAPIVVEVPDSSLVLSDGGDVWSSQLLETMGELNIQVWAAGSEEPPVSIPGLPVTPPHGEVADGWGGDRLRMYEGPNGAWIIDWQTEWDTQADADEFEARVTELQSGFAGPTYVSSPPKQVRVIVGSDANVINLLPR